MSIEETVRAELIARGVSAVDAELMVRGVSALIDIWGNAAGKKAAAMGAVAATKIVTEEDAETAQRKLL